MLAAGGTTRESAYCVALDRNDIDCRDIRRNELNKLAIRADVFTICRNVLLFFFGIFSSQFYVIVRTINWYLV